jgi:hypothetical protein
MIRSGLIFLFFVLLVGCAPDDIYLVNDEFKPYVQSFMLESAKRQQAFDFNKTGLIIEFADLDTNTAGLCHFEKPIRIQIDREYWEKITGKSGDSLMKEQVIFHELGHGFLKRDHDNSLLPNGDWKSLMCGGSDKKRSSNINYRGIRRNYYIDELFDSGIDVPDFASNVCSVDTTDLIQQLYWSFDTENMVDVGWPLVDNNNYKMSIENRQLRFDSRSGFSYIMLVKTQVDVLSDFVFEITIQCQSLNSSSVFGMVFGNNNESNASLEYMSINNNQNFYMGNFNCYSYYTELFVKPILPSKPNRLKIIKNGAMLYYFVNNTYIYCSEVDCSLSGNSFGFVVAPDASFWIDDLKIKSRNTSDQSMQSSKLQFSVEKFDFNLENIKIKEL